MPRTPRPWLVLILAAALVLPTTTAVASTGQPEPAATHWTDGLIEWFMSSVFVQSWTARSQAENSSESPTPVLLDDGNDPSPTTLSQPTEPEGEAAPHADPDG